MSVTSPVVSQKLMNTTNTMNISSRAAWMLAIRPRTLPASISPVIVGTSLAIADKGFNWLPAIGALAGALLLQIGVNLANDYFDSVKGVDTPDRLGPTRVTHSGLIEPARVKMAMMITFGVVIFVGMYLISVGGWPILVIGSASILSALAYSGGPYPLASHGLGDLFVFIFFGLAAVCGTYFVQALHLTPLVLLTSVPVGLLITAILVVNNLRDIRTDRTAGKRTLAVLLGKRGARIEYVLLLGGAYAMPAILTFANEVSTMVLLPLLTLPLAVSLGRTICREGGEALNRALVGTARLTLLFCLLFAAGLVFS